MNPSPSLSLDSSTPNPNSLRQWITALCIIRFDNGQGTVEDCFPHGVLPTDRLLLVADYSFPDSMYHQLPIHDSIFSFRLPDSTGGYVYGYVFNRQRHDCNLPQGSELTSIVILSPHPYSSVFRPLLQIVGPRCCDLGPSAIRLVASYIAAWPAPCPGLTPIDLSVGEAVLRALLPPDTLFPDADLLRSFRGILPHLWTLWELMLVGEPILVLAPSPPQCSEAMTSLISLISPLFSSVDFRPYFTILDPEVTHLTSDSKVYHFLPMILGVTNLFFLKALGNFPRIVSIGCYSSSSNVKKLAKFSPSRIMNAMKARSEGPLSLICEHKEALWTSYTAITKPDATVFNKLSNAVVPSGMEKAMMIGNNEILKRSFNELTINFLAPFGPYFRPTASLKGNTTIAEQQQLLPFDADEFLNKLEARGPGEFLSKRMRSNWLDLYRRFLQGKNFTPWFQKRRAAAEEEQQRLWRQVPLNGDTLENEVFEDVPLEGTATSPSPAIPSSSPATQFPLKHTRDLRISDLRRYQDM